MIKDYSLTLTDSAGRACVLHVCGAEVWAAVQSGFALTDAFENSENNQFENAVARGDIGADAWLVNSGRPQSAVE